MTTTEALIKPTIFFDGYCNLCNGAVMFVIKRDKKNLFQFASLQSELGQIVLKENNLPNNNFNTLLLVKNGKVFTFSTAALTIAKDLSGLWPLLYAAIILPEKIRNTLYNYIAKNRYRWFGKKEQCDLFSIEIQNRIIQ
jgi:predicted DCC family thiol-disulfide oxidoreductase YuxK